MTIMATCVTSLLLTHLLVSSNAITNPKYLSNLTEIPGDIPIGSPKIAFWNNELVLLTSNYLLHSPFVAKHTNWDEIGLIQPLNWTVTQMPVTISVYGQTST
eukprot:418782_1